jgi:hypothetical protein
VAVVVVVLTQVELLAQVVQVVEVTLELLVRILQQEVLLAPQTLVGAVVAHQQHRQAVNILQQVEQAVQELSLFPTH